MLTRLAEICSQTKLSLPYSQQDIFENGDLSKVLPAFIRAIRDAVSDSGISDVPEAALAEIILLGILAEVFQYGACGEQACLMFIKILEQGLFGSELKRIEMINLAGIPLKEMVSVWGEEFEYKDHAVVVVNRDEEKSTLEQFKTWRGVTVVNCWGEHPVREYKNDEVPTSLDLVDGLYRIKTVDVLDQRDQNLSLQEWKSLASLLEGFAQPIQKCFAGLWKEHITGNPNIGPGYLVALAGAAAIEAKVLEALKNKIKRYQLLADPNRSFIIRQVSYPSDLTLFKAKPRGEVVSIETTGEKLLQTEKQIRQAFNVKHKVELSLRSG